jgi:hypothetical protein
MTPHCPAVTLSRQTHASLPARAQAVRLPAPPADERGIAMSLYRGRDGTRAHGQAAPSMVLVGGATEGGGRLYRDATCLTLQMQGGSAANQAGWLNRRVGVLSWVGGGIGKNRQELSALQKTWKLEKGGCGPCATGCFAYMRAIIRRAANAKPAGQSRDGAQLKGEAKRAVGETKVRGGLYMCPGGVGKVQTACYCCSVQVQQ